jgi:LysR family transcriptional regulator, glycine cleavage system transcriptional activator
MHPIDRRRLPPLNALRGFEAAARHSSFVKAAEELSLTQSAVSHQVRQLEAALGQRLFLRLPREIALTDAGRDFLETVKEAIELLSVGVARLAPYKSSGSLIVASDAAFARFWLMPHLAEFRKLRPDIEIWLDTSEQLLDFDRQEVEFVVGRLRAVGAERAEESLFDDSLGPCLRVVLQAKQRIPRLEDLGDLTLVHDERRENWLVWLRAVGVTNVDSAAGPHFSDPGLAIDAARAGQGVVLASDVLAIDDLESGALVAPFDQWLQVPDEYRLSYPLWLADNEVVQAFASYLRAAGQKHQERLNVLRQRARLVPAVPAL